MSPPPLPPPAPVAAVVAAVVAVVVLVFKIIKEDDCKAYIFHTNPAAMKTATPMVLAF